jgi:isopenicillin N synthase-like dioxygenase
VVVIGVAPQDVLDAIRSAGENVGVIQVVNHGVPLSLITEHDRRTSALLAKPREEKACSRCYDGTFPTDCGNTALRIG